MPSPPLATHTHTHTRYSCTHSLTHVCSHTSANTPKAFSACDAAWGARAGYKQQGVWHSRRRCVGRPYAFHQALMKMNAHTLNHAQYCHIRKKKNTQKTIYSLISYFSWLSLSYSDTHTYSKSFTGFRWYTPTGIVILPQNHWWFKKSEKDWAGGKSWHSAIQWWRW